MSKLKITILGCGSSGGVPRVGFGWGDCDPNEPRNRRRRCALLVEQIADHGGRTSVLIDAGPDLREQLLSVNCHHLDAVLLTHDHADHVHGIDDLRSINWMVNKPIDVFADAATLERSLAAYMRSQPASWEEALDMTSLLFNELAAAAADCHEPGLLEELRNFAQSVARASGDEAVQQLELAFQDLLFRMVDRPLFELLTRVTLRFSASAPLDSAYRGALDLDRWKVGRRLIIDAILRHDAQLARFEANRNNRDYILAWLQHMRS